MSAEKNSTERLAPGIAEVLAGRGRDEKGRIPAKWTKEAALLESKKFKTRKEFREKSNSAYQYLVRKNIIHLASFSKEEKRHRVPDFEVICAIKSCSTRKEMYERFPGEYSAARKRRHIKEIYNNHFGRGKTSKHWNAENVLECASRFETRADFARQESGAYDYAYANGILEEACSHMDRKLCEYDVAYFWISDEKKEDGSKLVKVGVTSKRLGLTRVYQVAKKHRLSPIEIFTFESTSSLSIEKKMKTIGVSAGFSGVDGSSEFYYMSDEEITTLKEMQKWKNRKVKLGSKSAVVA